IALDLARFDAVVDRLLAGPMLGVQTRIHDQAARAEQFGVELTETSLDIVAIPAGFGRQSLGIERPSFGQRGNAAERADLPEPRQGLVLNLQADLKVVTGNRLVIDD